MAEVAFVAITKIGSVLGKKIWDEVKAMSDKATALPDNLDNIKKDLGMMSGVIQDLDSTELERKAVQEWIGELRTVSFRVEDLMDKCLYHSYELHEESSVTKFFRKSYYEKMFSGVAVEVEKVMKEIENVKKLRKDWLPMDQAAPKSTVAFDRRGSQGFFPVLVQDEDLVGIQENQSILIKWLDCIGPDSTAPDQKEPDSTVSVQKEPDKTVITVSGMGGLGKSTLVANVYDRMKHCFEVSAWITVSQTYTPESLLTDLLWKIGHTGSMDHMDTFGLKQEIRSRLQGSNKCLVVLDDVWDRDVYEKLQDVFKDLKSARVIITTRRDDVASLATLGHHLQLQPLKEADARRLFCARAFNNTMDRKCPAELEELVSHMVERCKGLPLAIVSMGSLMSTKPRTEFAWNREFKQFRSQLSKADDVQAILKLSYNNLPGNLRNCFLYCSLFPEDYTIARESLVRQWVAEGFAVAHEGNTAEDVAELNLMELITRNMLEVVDYDELGRVSTCKMHDIVRDLALSTAKKEKFCAANHRGELLRMEKDEVRRLSSYAWTDSDSKTEGFKCLRTLMSFQSVTSTTQMLDSIFTASKYLTVLELQDSAITEVPSSIQNLFNLHYLGLRRTRVKSLPDCIEKLSNLQTLDIKQTKIEKLPRGIVKVKKLRHLLADRVVDERQSNFQYFIGVPAPKDLSHLEELQTLETVQASEHLAEELQKMSWLQSLWITNVNAAHSAKLFASLSTMPLLSSLLLNASDEEQALCLDALNPTESRKLHRLIIRGRWAAGTLDCPIFHFHGKNLKYLALSWSGLMQDPLQLLAEHVPNLVYLSLNRASSVETLDVSEGCFPKLRTLVLKNLFNVNQITIGKGALQSIEGLYVVSLSSLDNIPQNIETLTSLKKLWLLYLHGDFNARWYMNGMHTKMAYVQELKLSK